MLKAFSEIHTDALSAFKKIYIQIKLISKHEKKINDLNSALYSLKEENASLVVELFNASDTLDKKIVNMDCVTYPNSKHENENIKG